MSSNRRSVHFDVPDSPAAEDSRTPTDSRSTEPACRWGALCESNCIDPLQQHLQRSRERPARKDLRPPQWVFRCPACQAVFTHFILLSIHTWSHSPSDVKVPPIAKQALPPDFDPKPPRCFVCTLKFSTKDSLRAHIAGAHPHGGAGSGEFECPFCEVRFETSIELISHIEIGSHPWKDGDFYPIYSGVLRNQVRHLHREELEQLVADFNDLCVPDRGTDEENISPPVEEERQDHPARLKSALRKSTTHRPFVYNYQCGKCGTRFAHGNQLKAHVDLRHKGSIISSLKQRSLHSCVHCKNKYKSLTALRKHLDYDHYVKTTPARITALPSSCNPENFGDLLLQKKIALDFENY